MSKEIDQTGGPAFPGGVVYDPRRESMEHMGAYMDLGGMSLRDWFAGQVISPMLVQAYGSAPRSLASIAYEIADAMLEVRSEPKP